MKRSIIALFVLSFAFLFLMTISVELQAEELVKCAVTGKEIKKSESKGTYEYKGETYYFCCTGCKETFVKNPEKYIGKANQELHTHEAELHEEHSHEAHSHDTHMHEADNNGKVKDPVCGMEFDKDKAKATYEYNGKTYYFCMEGCKEKFVASPEKYIKTEAEVVKCTVMGHEIADIEKAESYEYKGKTYYFCCAGCKEKFIADPEKYIK